MSYTHWKITVNNNKPVRRNSRSMMLLYLDNLDKEMLVERLEYPELYFTTVKHYIPPGKCKCGAAFDDFYAYDFYRIDPTSTETIMAVFDVHPECFNCYYTREYNNGRWVPAKFLKNIT